MLVRARKVACVCQILSVIRKCFWSLERRDWDWDLHGCSTTVDSSPDTCLKIENKNMEFQTSSVVYREYLQNKKFNLLCRTRNNVERRNSTERMSTSDLHSDLQTNVQLLSFEGIVKWYCWRQSSNIEVILTSWRIIVK